MNRLKYVTRLLAVLIVFLFSLIPGISMALGFGQIKLFSYLNESLDAEVELLGANDLDTSHLIASLASAEDFKKAGISRPYYLNKLRFAIARQANRTFVHITTEEAVKQPFLEFLVVLTWPEGRLVRGYTILLDPAPLGGIEHRSELTDEIIPKEIPKKDQQTLLKIQEKLAKNFNVINLNNKKLAKTDNMFMQDTPNETGDRSPELIAENLEALFESESTQKPVDSAQIEKSLAVSIDSPSGSPGNTHPNGSDSAQGSPNQTNYTLTNFSDKIKQIDLMTLFAKISEIDLKSGLYQNKFLLGSGLALLFSVAVTVCFLKRARETLPIVVKMEAKVPEKPVELFDDEMNLKLDLARQYIAVEDLQSARDILEEVITRGNQREKESATLLLERLLIH